MGLSNTTAYYCLTHRATFELSRDQYCERGRDIIVRMGAVTPCRMVRGWFVWHTDDERPPK